MSYGHPSQLQFFPPAFTYYPWNDSLKKTVDSSKGMILPEISSEWILAILFELNSEDASFCEAEEHTLFYSKREWQEWQHGKNVPCVQECRSTVSLSFRRRIWVSRQSPPNGLQHVAHDSTPLLWNTPPIRCTAGKRDSHTENRTGKKCTPRPFSKDAGRQIWGDEWRELPCYRTLQKMRFGGCHMGGEAD